ncbi:JAB domain-containing protein [Nitrogeniibacter aestuarii]|uniref:JAB domain-containing protein n=1 Tax=Nitrogeniibacter aestuarii TaxID=2815343 RepID=UPI001E2A0C19|nr:DNA repair protein RadC [Nitrogeniibacter aestuarii]
MHNYAQALANPKTASDVALISGFYGDRSHDVLKGCGGSIGNVIRFARGSEDASSVALVAALEILQRAMEVDARSSADYLLDPASSARFFRLRYVGLSREIFVVAFLDAQNRVIATETMFEGTLTQTSVHPREIARRALELDSAAVIVSHNHPSGLAEPSNADKYLTETLRTALATLDIRVLDHVIVAGPKHFSFAESGLV